MAKLAFTEKQALIHSFLMSNQGAKFTAYQIADELGMERKSINALVTGMCTKGYTVREESEGTDAEGKKVIVKFVVLTDAGVNYDEASAVAHDEAEAEAAKEAKKVARAAAKAEKAE